MIDIDLTISDEDDDDDIVVIKSKIIDFNQNNQSKPRSSQIDKDVYTFFYGTEDKTKEFLSIQHPASRKIVRNNFTIFCSKCNQYFNNITFINHVMDHFNIDLHSLDNLLLPKCYENVNNQQWCAIKCEICDLKFTSFITLGQHLQKKHVYKDMPYVCFVCNFYRTSFLTELKQHFNNFHKFSQYLVCPICIEVFELNLKDQNSDVLDAAVFLAHLDKHMMKRQFSCDRCVLKYYSKSHLIFHSAIYHDGRDIPDDQISDLSVRSYKPVVKKSLNVTSQQIDVSKLIINVPKLSLTCTECHETLQNLSTHYQSYIMCSQCSFSTYCAVAYRKHTKSMHGLPLIDTCTINTIDIYKEGVLLCECGFQSLHGDKVAQHLTKCSFNHCSVKSRGIHNLKTSQGNVQSKDDVFISPALATLSSASINFYKTLQLENIDLS